MLALGLYLGRIGSPSLRGEESRRARFAVEMTQSGDFIVPRQQGQPFPDRPPLQIWLIAGLGLLRGRIDLFAIRLPSLAATVMTVVLIYWYARAFLAPLGALAAGCAFATMGQVMQIGRLAETESLFTLFVSASLLLWHLAYMWEWPPWASFGLGWILCALGALTKGPQAPIYFLGASVLFLARRRDWRYLLSPGFAAGLTIFVVAVGAWQVPAVRRGGWEMARATWLGHANQVFFQAAIEPIGLHLLVYPFAVLGDTLPWSAALFLFAVPQLAPLSESERPYVDFLVLCLMVAFPTCWLPPHALPRYFKPLYPALAILCGVAIQHCWQAATNSSARLCWNRAARVMSTLILLAGAAILVVSFGASPKFAAWAQPRSLAVLYAAGALLTAWSLYRTTEFASSPHSWRLAVVGFASFAALTYSGVVGNMLNNKSVDTAAAVARLKRELPPSVHLVSIEPVHHLFAYYYQQSIELVHASDAARAIQPGDYFCFNQDGHRAQQTPFPWTRLDQISVSRSRYNQIQNTVIIGRRLLRSPPATVSGLGKSR
jgi:4-amino-4-deoxy-L-arabinose transferase-like glycosyltransferase